MRTDPAVLAVVDTARFPDMAPAVLAVASAYPSLAACASPAELWRRLAELPDPIVVVAHERTVAEPGDGGASYRAFIQAFVAARGARRVGLIVVSAPPGADYPFIGWDRSPVDAYLNEPVDPDELSAVVRRVAAELNRAQLVLVFDRDRFPERPPAVAAVRAVGHEVREVSGTAQLSAALHSSSAGVVLVFCHWSSIVAGPRDTDGYTQFARTYVRLRAHRPMALTMIYPRMQDADVFMGYSGVADACLRFDADVDTVRGLIPRLARLALTPAGR